MTRQPLVLCAILAACFAADARSGILLTVRESDNMLRRFDTETLTFRNIGRLDARFEFGDLAWDSSTQTLYMVQGTAGSGLYTVDPLTGSTTLVGDHGFDDMFGLTYDPLTDTLYGSRSSPLTGVYALDRSDGSATLVGDPLVNLDGLAYDSRRDVLVGAEAGPGVLHEIDRTTGSATILVDGEYFDNCGLAHDPEADLFWLVDWSGDLYLYDPLDGYARTLVFSGLGAHDGLAWTGWLFADGFESGDTSAWSLTVP